MGTKDLTEECNGAIPGRTHGLEQLVRSKSQAGKAHKKQIATKIASVPWTEADDKRLAMLVQRTVVNALTSLHPSKHVCGPCDLVHRRSALTLCGMQIKQHGKDGMDWCLIASVMQGRTSRQCRERFYNHVDENVNKRPWSEEEDRIIITCHAEMGAHTCLCHPRINIQPFSLLLNVAAHLALTQPRNIQATSGWKWCRCCRDAQPTPSKIDLMPRCSRALDRPRA